MSLDPFIFFCVPFASFLGPLFSFLVISSFLLSRLCFLHIDLAEDVKTNRNKKLIEDVDGNIKNVGEIF